MAIAVVINALGTLSQLVRNVLDGIKSKRDKELNLELLRIEKQKLEDGVTEFRKQVLAELEKEKSDKRQQLISRGLSNSTVSDTIIRDMEKDAYDRIERAEKEVTRAIEEIAVRSKRLR